jgi:hypothetical protein
MQQIGQHALAVHRRAGGLAKQTLQHVEVVEQTAQHRQHALLAPAVAVAAELQHARFPLEFVAVECIERGPVESERHRRERRAHQTSVIRVRACRQPMPQFRRLLGLEHRIPIG